MNLKTRLIIMNFLEFAVWGAYLTCMGIYLGKTANIGNTIGLFYAMQGIVSIFMPAIIGVVADKWIPAQKMLGICHLLAGTFMFSATSYALLNAGEIEFAPLFLFYSLSVAFYMPTLALSNSVAFNALTRSGHDTVKAFPPIRVFGTIGFIVTMWVVDLLDFESTPYQFAVSGLLSVILGIYSFSLPACPVRTGKEDGPLSISKVFGLDAFRLFRDKQMAIFFVFSMLLGVSLQITNGFATPYIDSFSAIDTYMDSFGVRYPEVLYSLSQISETACILLIPFFMKRYGIKNVMLIAMFAWFFRFGLLGYGSPAMPGLILFILSMIIYGVAFDFFNISGALFVDKNTTPEIRSSAQGLFMLMTNGIGATLGSLGAQAIVSTFTHSQAVETAQGTVFYTVGDWRTCWTIFAVYALIVGILFAIIFSPKKENINA